jgi:hypothetical protein
MRIKWIAISMITVALCAPSVTKVKAQGFVPPAEFSYEQEPGAWDAPPSEFREIQRQGYHDGIEGARKDYDNHRRPDVNNRDEYRHPHVEESAREDYREGYRRGYEKAMEHLMNVHDDRDHH